NLGTLYRDAGRHEQALEIFLNLLPEADRKFRLSLLDSISVTYISLRRPEKAEPYLEEMASLARGPQAGSRIAILATLAAVKSTVGEQRREALTLLRQIPIDEADDLEALLPYASAWINLAQHPELIEPEDRKTLAVLAPKIKNAFDATLESGDMLTHMHTNRL